MHFYAFLVGMREITQCGKNAISYGPLMAELSHRYQIGAGPVNNIDTFVRNDNSVYSIG